MRNHQKIQRARVHNPHLRGAPRSNFLTLEATRVPRILISIVRARCALTPKFTQKNRLSARFDVASRLAHF